jgi:hypothetical protein
MVVTTIMMLVFLKVNPRKAGLEVFNEDSFIVEDGGMIY